MNVELERQIDLVLDVPIDNVIGSDTNLTRRGSNLVGICPLCGKGAKTPPFTVFSKTNSCKCFSCLEGGNTISYVIKKHGLTFMEAVKRIAKENNIPWNDDYKPTEGEVREGARREAARILMKQVADYYVANLESEKPQKDYVINRWDEKTAKIYGIGFARDSWNDLLNHAKASGWNIELLEELGMLKRKENSDHLYDFFRGRIMIPIRDRWGNIIAFTGRDTTKADNVAKYINNKETFLYSKGKTLFGIDTAYVMASKERKVYVMEGAPDVIRMNKISVFNSVASLGTAFTEEQFALLKKMNVETLCFIPDQDEPGLKALQKNALSALRNGFAVSVKTIPTEPGKKEDADSYFNAPGKFEAIKEEDFIIFHATELFRKNDTIADKNQCLEEIAAILSTISSEGARESYVSRLTKIYGKLSVWKKAIAQCQKDAVKKSTQNQNTFNLDTLQQYGFLYSNNCYFSISDNGSREQWSNFTMIPLFHIKDATNPKRMYSIKNCFGYECIIEMKQEELVSMNKFKMKLEGLGNFIWEAGERELIKLKKFLYEKTETATEITQLGWQKTGNFFAFGNGGFNGSEFIKCNEYGIIKMDGGNYYLPAASKIYQDEENLFQFERRFVHDNNGSISLYDYAVRMINVFGDNAKIGLCFLMATLFKDIIVRHTKSFPILNLFGPKGAGKSEMGHSLMSFFIPRNTPPNLSNSTIPALADAVAQCSNALVHLDEFKNSIDLEKREFLKGLWDNAGRSRMNMDKDKKREITNVDSGIIVSGQEMATADIALFSRFVFLCFTQTEYSDEERNRFQSLKNVEGLGLSHLTLQILKYRREMSLNFTAHYTTCATDLSEAIKQRHIKVEDRIYRNWLILLATYRTLHEYLTLPFDYDEIKALCVDMIIRQNKECKSNNELSGFWSMISYLNQSREIYLNADFKIKFELSLRLKGGRSIENKEAKQYLYLRKDRIFQLYQYHSKISGAEKPLDKISLIFYLQNSPEFVGEKQTVRFKNIIRGMEEKKEDAKGNLIATSGTAQAMLFDYDLIRKNYDIDLDTYESTDADEEDSKVTQPGEDLPF